MLTLKMEVLRKAEHWLEALSMEQAAEADTATDSDI